MIDTKALITALQQTGSKAAIKTLSNQLIRKLNEDPDLAPLLVVFEKILAPAVKQAKQQVIEQAEHQNGVLLLESTNASIAVVDAVRIDVTNPKIEALKAELKAEQEAVKERYRAGKLRAGDEVVETHIKRVNVL